MAIDRKENVRVIGGGNTLLTIKGLAGDEFKTLHFLATASDSPGKAVGQAVSIQGVGDVYPVEIVTPYAQSYGKLTLTVWEFWNKNGWENISGLEGVYDLVTLFKRQREAQSDIEINKVIVQPGSENLYRVRAYEGAKIVDVDASETIDNKSMDKQVKLEVWYRKYTDIYDATSLAARGTSA